MSEIRISECSVLCNTRFDWIPTPTLQVHNEAFHLPVIILVLKQLFSCFRWKLDLRGQARVIMGDDLSDFSFHGIYKS